MKIMLLRAYLKCFKEWVDDFCRAIDENKTFVYYNLGHSPEILLAFGDDIFPFPIESYVLFQSIMGDIKFNLDAIDLAESHGSVGDSCSVDKIALGYYLQNVYPPAVCNVFTSTPCDSQSTQAEMFGVLTGKPTFFVDLPYLSGHGDILDVADQLKEEVKFLEQQLNRKINWERLRENCEENNKMAERLLEWNHWRKSTPCPQVSKVAAFLFALQVVFSGTKTGTYIASELAAEAQERAMRGEGVVEEGRKEIRAVWYHDAMWFDLSFYDWMESELGMVVPMDLFGYFAPEGFIDTSTPDTMLEGIARKWSKSMPMSRQFKGPDDHYIKDFTKLMVDYKADCGIFAGHIGCKHAWGLVGHLKEVFRELDIPLLVFEFDMFDPRITSVEAMEEQFRRFVNDVVRPKMDAKMVSKE